MEIILGSNQSLNGNKIDRARKYVYNSFCFEGSVIMNYIDDLFNLEKTIYRFYEIFQDMEAMGTISLDDDSEWMRNIERIKLAKKGEEILVSKITFDISDFDEFKTRINSFLENIAHNSLDRKRDELVAIRLLSRIIGFMERKLANGDKQMQFKLSLILASEYNDIFFTFLDEAIKNNRDSLQSKLIEHKYQRLFCADSDYEEKILERKLVMGQSPYLCSDFQAGLLGANKMVFKSMKDGYALLRFREMEDIRLSQQKYTAVELLILSLQMRSLLLLLNDDTFEICLEGIKEADRACYRNDRKRYKRISFGLKY